MSLVVEWRRRSDMLERMMKAHKSAFPVWGSETLEVVPLSMKAIGWQGGSILALETLKRVVVARNRAWDVLVAQGLRSVIMLCI
ncbi:dnaJ homolog subfamily C GRV2 isoform X2 [Lactuca sativa]|uniref:dnaJ homolog subfamily C GRV2 isoform X2 n=1 Tax=Lactuca sativa TaxID=4236 RepID=UPI0022AFE7FC|nr:dnaJ homolog subfamily C GRV2 isoform X2 [Lactuca sativa]XP_052624183.1 dnaJ homolog subfamily C GRV2 isoform X2 [Lactuca sativa]XP_052624184.1 dnaJ homolog subfamily C GRV2 isoform X2 [Lactuca sativa]